MLQALYKKAKPGEWRFAEEAKTDLCDEQRASEIVREKLFKYLNRSVPFDLLIQPKGMHDENNETVLLEEIVVRMKSLSQT